MFIISEIGKNFVQKEQEVSQGEYLENAFELIREAKRAGADAVKFQTHVLEDEQLNIRIKSPHFDENRYHWIQRNEDITTKRFWDEIKAYSDEQEIQFFTTPMSRLAAQKVNHLVDIWKVGSGDIQDYLLLDYLIETDKPIIISTGMVSLAELDEVVERIGNHVPLTILYCISKYPAKVEDFDLGKIELFKEKYPDCVIGFSDHSLGSDMSIVARGFGAQVIEKHFTMNRDHYGPDHKASLEPEEFKQFVQELTTGKYIPLMKNSKTKELDGATNKFRPYFNKVLRAGTDIKEKEKITTDMLYAMRPAKVGGIPAHKIDSVIDTKAVKDFKKYDEIKI